jgi:CRP/FNR family nitrogen fixation transcriptional regulator
MLPVFLSRFRPYPDATTLAKVGDNAIRVTRMHVAGGRMNAPVTAMTSDSGLPPCNPGLQTAGAVRHFAPNQQIFREGDAVGTYFKVVAGVVRTCRLLSGGRRQVDDFHVPDDLFGFEMGPLRRHSAEAACHTTVILYRHLSAEALAANNQDIARRLFAQAVRSLSRAQDHAVLLGRCTALEKVAAFLIDWAAIFQNTDEIILAVTRQDIADYLGLTVETVSRILARLEGNALIELSTARRIRLTDPVALRALAS